MPHGVKNDLLANNLVSKGNIFIVQKKQNQKEFWKTIYKITDKVPILFYMRKLYYSFVLASEMNKNNHQFSDRKYTFLFLANKNSLASGKPASPYYDLLNTLKKPKGISNPKCAAGVFIVWDSREKCA